jgi:hypothetical protein
MKELRFDASYGLWRVAFAFDPTGKPLFWSAETSRAGAKSAFTASSSKKADARFDAHLARIKKEKQKGEK